MFDDKLLCDFGHNHRNNVKEVTDTVNKKTSIPIYLFMKISFLSAYIYKNKK